MLLELLISFLSNLLFFPAIRHHLDLILVIFLYFVTIELSISNWFSILLSVWPSASSCIKATHFSRTPITWSGSFWEATNSFSRPSRANWPFVVLLEDSLYWLVFLPTGSEELVWALFSRLLTRSWILLDDSGVDLLGLQGANWFVFSKSLIRVNSKRLADHLTIGVEGSDDHQSETFHILFFS